MSTRTGRESRREICEGSVSLVGGESLLSYDASCYLPDWLTGRENATILLIIIFDGKPNSRDIGEQDREGEF